MDFPITEYVDEDACYEKIVDLLVLTTKISISCEYLI